MERTQTPELSNKILEQVEQAAYAQGLFIFIQSVLFPELGTGGAIFAALCAMMPWIVMYAKKMPILVFSMVVTSLLLTPLFSMLCLFILEVIGESVRLVAIT